MSVYAYFPGCSLSASGRDYDESVRAVFEALNLTLREIPDWNCCGASSGFLVNKRAALAWNGRNLNWAAKERLDVVVPCTGCLKNARKTLVRAEESEKVRSELAEDLGEPFVGGIRAIHPLEVLAQDVGWAAIRERVRRQLTGIRVAPYYGCYLIRPPVGYDRSEDPQALDELARACGAEPVDFSYKTRCCGGAGFMTREDLSLELSADIVAHAKRAGADLMLVACPLCDLLLDCYQKRLGALVGEDFRMPVLYFTQFLGLALGVGEENLGLGGRITPVGGLLRKMRETLGAGAAS